MTPINTHKDTTTASLRKCKLILCVKFCSLCMKLARVKVKIKVTFTAAGSKSMTLVTFTSADVKSKVLAPLHRHEKRLKSGMSYKKVFILILAWQYILSYFCFILRLSVKCNEAVGNLTAEQAERVELNPVVSAACQRVMERHCAEVMKIANDEGDMMDCLIEHKNELDARSDYKCKAAVEHFQLLSLKSYHFTYKFKDACRPSVKRYCHE